MSPDDAPPTVDPGLACRKCGCRHLLPVKAAPLRNAKVLRRICRHCGATVAVPRPSPESPRDLQTLPRLDLRTRDEGG